MPELPKPSSKNQHELHLTEKLSAADYYGFNDIYFIEEGCCHIRNSKMRFADED
jgi:hypothetical protein